MTTLSPPAWRLFVFLCLCYVANAKEWTQEQLDSMPSRATEAKEFEGDARIIRGAVTVPGRYPYMVSLTASNDHKCGGTLIAPDLILTANHCAPYVGAANVGRYNISNPDEPFETFVFQEVLRHPRYYQQSANDVDEFDYAILKLYGTTNGITPIALNRDPSVPNTAGEELNVIGWGKPTVNGSAQVSDVLEEAPVFYIPDDECRNIKSGNIDLMDLVFEGLTLCAADFVGGHDSCTGDSGGPLMLKGQDAGSDIQLAIISYGFACADPVLPGMYARVTMVQDWIDENVCRMSLDPPAAFGCNSSTVSNEPDLSGELVDVTLELMLDYFPKETGWILQSPNENDVLVTYAYQPIGSLANETSDLQPNNITTVLTIPNNREYVFTLLDSFGDGNVGFALSKDGETLFDVPAQSFSNSLSTEFVLGVIPSLSPSQSSGPTSTPMPSPAPSVTPPFVTIAITFDNYPEETGWYIEALYPNADPVLIKQVFEGTYANDTDGSSIETEVTLFAPRPQPTTYRFTMTDNEHDGICCAHGLGSYQLWLGTPQDGILLAEGGKFVFEDPHTFVLDSNGNVVQAPSASPTSEPTVITPTGSPRPTRTANPKESPTRTAGPISSSPPTILLTTQGPVGSSATSIGKMAAHAAMLSMVTIQLMF